MSWLKGTLIDPERPTNIDFLIPLENLSELENTIWLKEIPTLKKQDYEDAINGDPLPLRRTLGTPPIQRAKRLPLLDSICKYSQDKSCGDRSENCRPGSGSLPNCYWAPLKDSNQAQKASEIGKAWDEGRYVFFIE